jgi:hypothetical protein
MFLANCGVGLKLSALLFPSLPTLRFLPFAFHSMLFQMSYPRIKQACQPRHLSSHATAVRLVCTSNRLAPLLVPTRYNQGFETEQQQHAYNSLPCQPYKHNYTMRNFTSVFV